MTFFYTNTSVIREALQGILFIAVVCAIFPLTYDRRLGPYQKEKALQFAVRPSMDRPSQCGRLGGTHKRRWRIQVLYTTTGPPAVEFVLLHRRILNSTQQLIPYKFCGTNVNHQGWMYCYTEVICLRQ